ncbi:metal ABC transporter permease [Aureimonas flava]|uniref:Metal ABC transporter permease n=1 Tax=Aureimonas flava TaxID=2320271 RepID=A0A3A1WJJ1_9HYPH|nr:metal ABC transporter permease [Aureimonas flava]RIX99194.1 metal ABC transporter permease [Aureimonas flava]
MSAADLLFPFQIDFLRQAFLAGAMIAVPCALLSCFLVLKGWSLMGDAVSHAVLPGIVLAYAAGLPLALGAFAAGLLCASGSGFLKNNSRIRQDTAMGVAFAGMFALGIVLHAKVRSALHLDHILFGDLLGLVPGDLLEIALIVLPVLLFVLLSWRSLLLHSFDPVQARVSGLPVRFLHYGLLAALSAAIVASMQAVGIILVVALLIAPGATAFLLTRSFGWMLLVAALFALVASTLGIYLSVFLDSAPAPTVVLVMTAGWVGALLFGRRAPREAEDAPAT